MWCVISGLAKIQTQAPRKGQINHDFSQAVNKGEDYPVIHRTGDDVGVGEGAGPASAEFPPSLHPNAVLEGRQDPLSGEAGAWHRSGNVGLRNTGGLTEGTGLGWGGVPGIPGGGRLQRDCHRVAGGTHRKSDPNAQPDHPAPVPKRSHATKSHASGIMQ